MTTYKDELARAMRLCAEYQDFRFVGYNVKYGSKANGTLVGISDHQLIETPVAENLVAGVAMGYALRGHSVMTWIERFDFVLNAFDAIVNHADKMKGLSDGQFAPNVIFRTIVGNKSKPLFTGSTHTQDFSEQLRAMVGFPVVQLTDPSYIYSHYREALYGLTHHSTVLVEYRELYDTICP